MNTNFKKLALFKTGYANVRLKKMTYPDDVNGDVFRRMESHGFDFDIEHVVDFHAVMATEEEADRVAKMFLADHGAGQTLEKNSQLAFKKCHDFLHIWVIIML